jgi:XTP/dITP diphosphohydrolase
VIVYCATTNPGKLREFNLIAAHYGAGKLEVLPVPGLKQIEPPEETGATFSANAALKAEYYSQFVDGMVFADDSGLAVDALNGAHLLRPLRRRSRNRPRQQRQAPRSPEKRTQPHRPFHLRHRRG